MRTSQYLLSTLKETPSDAVVISHQLMLRAGMIRKLASGLYTWMPMGLRVLRKAEAIVREEMNAAGALEVLMPAVQPAELWQESGRWEQYGPELLRIKDRHERDFCVGPTHEEVITDLARNELNSYKQLPINLYQIQTKFRDEIRPRFGLMRGREFIMKDAYSFHLGPGLAAGNLRPHAPGLLQRVHPPGPELPPGAGRYRLHRRHRLPRVPRAGRIRRRRYRLQRHAPTTPPTSRRPRPSRARRARRGHRGTAPGRHPRGQDHRRPGRAQFGLAIEKTVKTLVVHAAEEGKLIALIVRGDHELNEIKAANHELVASPLVFASEAEIRAAIGAGPGSLGPLNLPITCVIDRSVALMSDFGAGANLDGKHYFGLNWERDLPLPAVADLRNVVAGDPSPDGQGTLVIKRGIEVGHIFQLGTKYSEALRLHGPRRERQADHPDHGLLRHRRVARGGRGHRAELGRARHPLARGAWRRSRSPSCR